MAPELVGVNEGTPILTSACGLKPSSHATEFLQARIL